MSIAIYLSSIDWLPKALKSGKPLVVDFAADWCPDCQQMAPVLLELKQQLGRDVEFVTLDVSYAAPGQRAQKGSETVRSHTA